ncbi:MAG: hypothetical protein J0I12_02425 [Candidatus Eremiobacteraeota bacterium]|nr:hypothetical protein [Candidatus Eremiobacteraeota bacterium]
MKNALKPMLLAALMALPMVTAAHAEKVDDLLARRQELRHELAEHEREYKDAVAAKDWDRARDALHEVRDSERELTLNGVELKGYKSDRDDISKAYLLRWDHEPGLPVQNLDAK